MNATTFSTTSIQPLDALWALFMSQPKAVKRAFTKRVLAEDIEAQAQRNRLLVSHSIKQAFSELEVARQTGAELPDARNLFK